MINTPIYTHVTRSVLLSIALVTSSCMFGPDYNRPDMDVPAAFRTSEGKKATNESLADLPWWKVFKNRELQNLIEEALNNNKDLHAAISRAEQAREAAVITRSPIFPTLGYNGSTARGRNYPSASGGGTATSGSYNLSASWEIDLWGKIRRQTEASMAEYLATEEARRGIMLSLVSQVSMYYLQLIELDTELAITLRTVKSFEESLGLFKEQFEGGVGDVLQLSSAEAALASAAAQEPIIKTNIAQIENALSILTGRSPGKIKRNGSLNDIQRAVSIPAGIPAELLNRRPDLRQSEQQLRAANARVGVAISNYFPSINLTGSAGQVSGDLRRTTTSSTAQWGLGANLTGPLFQGGALTAGERQAKAAFMEAKSNYEQTMLKALGEVSDALIERRNLVKVIEQREKSTKAYSTAVDASKDRFKVGMSSYYEVLKAQQDMFPVELSLAQSKLSYAQTVVKLYIALGGGWNMDNDQFSRKK